MRILRPFVVIFGLILGLLCPHTSAESVRPEDLEASGDDLEISGSGEWPEEVIPEEKANDVGNTKGDIDTRMNRKQESSQEFEDQPWKRDGIVVSESKSFLDRKEVLAGVIAGGVTGLALAVFLAGVLIYKWQKKDETSYIQGQTRDQDYHQNIHKSSNSEQVVLV